MLPPDGHVHSEWSWDAPHGSMEQTCSRAVHIGLPAIAFTEHADFTIWSVREGELDPYPHLKAHLSPELTVLPPQLDLAGYQESLQRCRERFPGLRIISGVELGEPHWHSDKAAALLAAGGFERVLGSLHCLPIGERFCEPASLFREQDPVSVMRDYLAEIARMAASSNRFSVLAHIDYPIRYWPANTPPFDPHVLEAEFRFSLGVLAASGRALEVNTRGQFPSAVVRWWHEVGGEAVSFGSDAHAPTAVGHGFAQAAAMVEAQGFRPGRHPYDLWIR